jgi:Bacterial SH3 domain/Peptidase M15
MKQPGPGIASAPAPKHPESGRQAEPKHPASPTFMVANVRHDDVLNVRSGPSADFDIVAELAPGSRGIAIISECRSRWCPVQHDGATGWVNSVYLVPEGPVTAALKTTLNDGPPDPPTGPTLRDSPEAPRSCLKPAARALLDRIERKFGPVQVVSTCRAGALIAGTAHPSRHASGNAVDFKAGPRKAAILQWLIATHRAGGTMTYAGMDHIHVDIGPHFISLACGRHTSSWRGGPRDATGAQAADTRR